MGGSVNRLIEEISVGFSLLVALLSVAIYIGVEVSGVHSTWAGVLVFVAFWLYLCTVGVTALVVLVVNLKRSIQDTSPDNVAILLAAIILISICGGLYLLFVVIDFQAASIMGVVGLILAPLGLFVNVYEPHLRNLLSDRTKRKMLIAGMVIRHAGVIAGCVLFIPALYGLGIFSGIVSIESTGHSPGIGAVLMVLLPFTFAPPTLVIVGSLLIPGETRHSVIPRIVVTRGSFVVLGIIVVVVGPITGLVIWMVFTHIFVSGLGLIFFLLVPYLIGIISIIRGTGVYQQPETSHGH